MDSAGGAREGVRVENRTDATRRVDLDAGGASTTRRLDPGSVFVWRDAPTGGFDLRVTTDDGHSVTTVPRGTAPGDVTVVVAREGVSVDLPDGTATDAFATGTDATDTTDTTDTSETSETTGARTRESGNRTDTGDTTDTGDAFGADADDWGTGGDGGDGWGTGGDGGDGWGTATADTDDWGDDGDDRGDDWGDDGDDRGDDGWGGGGGDSDPWTGGGETPDTSSRDTTDERSSRDTAASSSAGTPTTDESTRDRSPEDGRDTRDTADTPDTTDTAGDPTGRHRADERTSADEGVARDDAAANERDAGDTGRDAGDTERDADHDTDTSETGDDTDTSETDPHAGDADDADDDAAESTPRSQAGVGSATPAAPDAPSPAAARTAFAESVRVDERLDELERRAVWLDQEFRIPGTNVRVGVSSIVGLLPGAGDGIMFLVALSLVYHGLRLGASTLTLVKMSFVLVVEFAVSVVPLLGDFVGAYWSANVQNVGYLRAERARLDGSTNWVFVLLLFSPSILTFLAVVSLL